MNFSEFTVLHENLNNVPALLKSFNRWIGWKSELRDGKPTKVPYDVETGNRASSTDERTWTNFRRAVSNVENNLEKYDGVGFVFNSDGIVGVDLDKCIGEDGVVESWALDIVHELDSYTEISPGGRGLHIFVIGNIPSGGNRRGRCEIYSRGRYFTITGNLLCD